MLIISSKGILVKRESTSRLAMNRLGFVQNVTWELKRVFECIIVDSWWFENGNKELSYVISRCSYCWRYRSEWWTVVYELLVYFSQTIQNAKVWTDRTKFIISSLINDVKLIWFFKKFTSLFLQINQKIVMFLFLYGKF